MPKAMLLVGVLLVSAAAQAAAPGPAPRLANGKPDLSGLWNNPYTPNMAVKGNVLDPKTREPIPVSGAALPDAKASAAGSAPRTLDLPYTEWGLKRWKSYDPDLTISAKNAGSRKLDVYAGVNVFHDEWDTWRRLDTAKNAGVSGELIAAVRDLVADARRIGVGVGTLTALIREEYTA